MKNETLLNGAGGNQPRMDGAVKFHPKKWRCKMWYLVGIKELEKLKNGELKIEDLANRDRQAIILWTGEDIKEMLKRKGKEELFDDVMNKIVDIDYCCEDCIINAVNYAIYFINEISEMR